MMSSARCKQTDGNSHVFPSVFVFAPRVRNKNSLRKGTGEGNREDVFQWNLEMIGFLLLLLLLLLCTVLDPRQTPVFVQIDLLRWCRFFFSPPLIQSILSEYGTRI